MKIEELKENARRCCSEFMTRDEAICLLQQHEADLKRLGVEHLYVFSSMGQQRDQIVLTSISLQNWRWLQDQPYRSQFSTRR